MSWNSLRTPKLFPILHQDTVAVHTLRIYFYQPNRDAPFGKKHPSIPIRNFTYLRGHAMLELHLTAIKRSAISGTISPTCQRLPARLDFYE
jgi:hypothetical protein